MAESTVEARGRADWTRGYGFGGRLSIWQPKSGYRHSIDPLILSAHVKPSPGARILDMGCGCGIMPLVICFRNPDASVVGVELQETLAGPACQNVIDNRMADRIRILCQDVNDLDAAEIGGPVDLIISNPPYKRLGTGRINPDTGRAIARHEIRLNIQQVFAASQKLLKQEGRLMLILPLDRETDLHAAAEYSGISMEWVRLVHQSRKKPPFRILGAAAKDHKGSCRVLPPLILNTRDNTPTKEHKALFNP